MPATTSDIDHPSTLDRGHGSTDRDGRWLRRDAGGIQAALRSCSLPTGLGQTSGEGCISISMKAAADEETFPQFTR